jgi:hypothetical protein
MPKQAIEVEVPDGWEAFAFRIPRRGESYVCGQTADSVIGCASGTATYEPRVIVRRPWRWPAWLKAPWIAMDEDGYWRGWLCEPLASPPVCGCGGWNGPGNLTLGPNSSWFDFNPPPCTDWRESKRKNPNV